MRRQKMCRNCGPVDGAVTCAGWCVPCTMARELNRQTTGDRNVALITDSHGRLLGCVHTGGWGLCVECEHEGES